MTKHEQNNYTQEHLKHLKKDKQLFVFMKREERAMQLITTEGKVVFSSSLILLRYFCVLFTPIYKQNKIFIQTFRCAIALWKSGVCMYSIRFQVIKLKLLSETLKNEKFLPDIETKCGDIANEILNVAVDAKRTFKCK